jgi:hypothetical protein
VWRLCVALRSWVGPTTCCCRPHESMRDMNERPYWSCSSSMWRLKSPTISTSSRVTKSISRTPENNRGNHFPSTSVDGRQLTDVSFECQTWDERIE